MILGLPFSVVVPLTLITLVIGFRVLFASLCAIFFSVRRVYHLYLRRRQLECSNRKYAVAHKRNMHIVLGGCGPREQRACERIVLSESLIEPSSSGNPSCEAPRDNYEIWVLSPARKRLRYFTEEAGVPEKCLRVKHASVDTVTNFSYHIHEFAGIMNNTTSSSFDRVVKIWTCKQHVARAQAVANAILIPFDLWPKVIPVDDRQCENCLSGAVKNGNESALRTFRDVVRALCWQLFRVDFSFVSGLRHAERSNPDRCDLDFDGVAAHEQKRD